MYFLALPRKNICLEISGLVGITATLMTSYNKTKMLGCNLKIEFVNIGV